MRQLIDSKDDSFQRFSAKEKGIEKDSISTTEEVEIRYRHAEDGLDRIGREEERAMSLTLMSPVFENDQEIPVLYTCEGDDISPALDWREVPAGAASLALIVDDPDAPDPRAPKMTWVHWVLYNLPASSTGLREGIPPTDLPAGTLEGLNDWKRTGWGGPCPPIGRHRYFFKLYALDTVLPDLHHPTKSKLEAAMDGHILAQAVLMGTYQKGAKKKGILGTLLGRP